MAGISSSGLPSTENYYIGRGKVHLTEIDSARCPIAWRLVGNSCALTINADTSTIEHFTCLSFTRVKDAEIISELNLDITVEFDEFQFENLATYFIGQANTYTQPAAGVVPTGGPGPFQYPNPISVTGSLADTRHDGRYYDIGILTTDGTAPNTALTIGRGPACRHNQRAYGIDPALLTVTVNSNAYTGIPEGQIPSAGQVEVDAEAGTIFVRAGSALAADMLAVSVAAGITDNDFTSAAAAVEYTGEISDVALDQVQGLTSSERTLSLKFLALNGNQAGERHEIIFHQIKLRPSGDLSLIQEDEFASFELSGSLEANPENDPDGGGFVTIRRIA